MEAGNALFFQRLSGDSTPVVVAIAESEWSKVENQAEIMHFLAGGGCRGLQVANTKCFETVA